MRSQCQLVLDYCEENGSITQADAFRDLGIGRLASRINDLRCLGYEIETAMESGENRYGVKTRYARYFIRMPEQKETASDGGIRSGE